MVSFQFVSPSLVRLAAVRLDFPFSTESLSNEEIDSQSDSLRPWQDTLAHCVGTVDSYLSHQADIPSF